MPNTPRILLIDDDQALLDMYRLKFKLDGGCELLTAADPVSAVAVAEREQPDLILLDLVLPKTERSMGTLNQEIGFQLLGELRASPATNAIPVVIFTNLDERTQGHVERAKALGAKDYWVKANLPPAEVIARVRALVA